MKISIIIPTHNRANQLPYVLDSILAMIGEADFEVVVVDNNSTDNTKEVINNYSDFARYVFEGSTAFTKARRTGAENALGDIFLYLDDDVIVNKGSLRRIVEIFLQYPECGVIAGKVMPRFVENPPTWALECQKSFNGWSLHDENSHDELKNGFQELDAAVGPMMAIRRESYLQVGGFPPDTVGVETNSGAKTFSKLYVGPGDYGLCYNIRKAGYKILYDDLVSVFHVIPPLRLTVQFWRSRMIGEGYHDAITQREFFHLGPISLIIKRASFYRSYIRFKKKLLKQFKLDAHSGYILNGLYSYELLVLYSKAYMEMDMVLINNPGLSKLLWEIADNGVANENYESVMARLPSEYLVLVKDEFVYDSTLLNQKNYEEKIKSPWFSESNAGLLILGTIWACFNISRRQLHFLFKKGKNFFSGIRVG